MKMEHQARPRNLQGGLFCYLFRKYCVSTLHSSGMMSLLTEVPCIDGAFLDEVYKKFGFLATVDIFPCVSTADPACESIVDVNCFCHY